MKTYLTLMQREWLQHRFGWTLLALGPLTLALLLLLFGQIDFSDGAAQRVGEAFPAVLTAVSMMGSTVLTFLVLSVTSLILMSGLARRDHQDRSIEFWLSLPTGHSASLAVPLLTHLLLVPAAALVIGMAGGWLLSLVLVTRLVSFEAWVALPWRDVIAAALAMLSRVIAGLPLALLWTSPLLLAAVLSNAWFKRWGVPVLLLTFSVGGFLLDRWLGRGAVAHVISDVLRHAGQALVATGQYHVQVDSADDVYAGIRSVPGWALRDFGGALQALVSPLFAGCLLTAAALFALLLDWRRRGAGVTG